MKISSLILSILKSILKIPRERLGEDYLYFHYPYKQYNGTCLTVSCKLFSGICFLCPHGDRACGFRRDKHIATRIKCPLLNISLNKQLSLVC